MHIVKIALSAAESVHEDDCKDTEPNHTEAKHCLVRSSRAATEDGGR